MCIHSAGLLPRRLAVWQAWDPLHSLLPLPLPGAQVVLDLDGDKHVTREEMMVVFKQLAGAEERLAHLHDARAVKLLNDASAALARLPDKGIDAFLRCDASGQGMLSSTEQRE